MAASLKKFFDAAMVHRIAREVPPRGGVPAAAFRATPPRGLDQLELMDRARHIAGALRRHLPDEPERALGILVDSLPPLAPAGEGAGMAPFAYLPHVLFTAEHGLDCFEAAMRAQHALTQRFTAEFSLRAYLTHHPAPTLARLAEWATRPERARAPGGLGGDAPAAAVGRPAPRVPGRPHAGARAARAPEGRPVRVRAPVGRQQPERHREGPSEAARGDLPRVEPRRDARAPRADRARPAQRGEARRPGGARGPRVRREAAAGGARGDRRALERRRSGGGSPWPSRPQPGPQGDARRRGPRRPLRQDARATRGRRCSSCAR